MDTSLAWGIQVILWFQQFSPTLDLPFIALTLLGEERFFLLFLPFLYWGVDRRLGTQVTLLFLLSTSLNAVAKTLAGQPRPFQYDPRVRQLVEAPEGGWPSGHAQNALVVWGYLALRFRRAWLWGLAGVLIVLISLSRVYLGVHFPTDILGGYLLGAMLLLAYLWLEPGLEAWLKQKGLAWQLGLTLTLPWLLIFLSPTEDGVSTGAALLGIGAGFTLERRWVGFETSGPWWQRTLRFIVGAVVMVGLWLGLKIIFSGAEPALVFRFIRYGLMGLWGALGAPWVFVKLGWAKRESVQKLAQTLVFTQDKA